jgi:hypothetical protein
MFGLVLLMLALLGSLIILLLPWWVALPSTLSGIYGVYRWIDRENRD